MFKKKPAHTIACSKSHDKVFTNESDNTGEIAWFIKSYYIRINNCIMITGWVHRRQRVIKIEVCFLNTSIQNTEVKMKMMIMKMQMMTCE